MQPYPATGQAPEEPVAQIELMTARLARFAYPHSTEFTLERSSYLILQDLVDHGPSKISDIAARMLLDGSTMTRQVTLLERSGRVARAKNPSDGRHAIVYPTEQGITDLAQHREERRQYFHQALREWSALDKSLLAELLNRFVQEFPANNTTVPPSGLEPELDRF